ncbi:MAG: glycoside hydrolase family 57 protein [Candidatus Campbellbacteria bacterium]|nr:glycoside hydrolase family 57 protein [Candidatus Campbellbacteria bacterium]
MTSICLYMQVHQPRRLKKYRIFDIGSKGGYFDDVSDTDLNNRKVFQKVARKCYLPTNSLMLDLLKKHPEFRLSFSITGIFLDQAEEYSPETLESFKKLVDTGQVEILSETYYHSLAFLYSQREFEEQTQLHKERVKELFGVEPTVFRNTELIYNNELAKAAERMGYRGVLAEGVDNILGWRSPNFVYRPQGTDNISLLLKNYRLSDDIAFRFSSSEWAEYPLTAEKFANWISSVNGSGEIVNLFMDYETFGEHQWEDTGIFDFLRALPTAVYKNPDNDFVTPTEAIDRYERRDEIDIPHYISWADVERDLSAWLHNDMQKDAIKSLYEIEDKVKASKDKKLINDWRTLTTSDHFYYMCTKWWSDGDVHKYFSPYDSPYDAFITFMNVLNDVTLRV